MMAPHKRRPRIVVVAVDPSPSFTLPGRAEFRGPAWVGGGQRTLYELAAAAVALGHEVELRGRISEPVLRAVSEAAGVEVPTPTDARRPTEDDVVIISEGGDDPLRFARVVLSPARVVLLVLAPPGLFGWPFAARPAPADPLTVPLADLARPEHFRAIAALDIDVWTHMHRVQELALSVGARCEFIGNGDPGGAPALPGVKDIDVAYLEGSRWRELAEQAVALMDRPVHQIAVVDNTDVVDAIGRTKVLIWPARVEGHGRILQEARIRGTVVVALRSNVYATGLGERYGTIAVDEVAEIPAVVERLLGDPQELAKLAAAGRATAVEQIDWHGFVERVGTAIEHVIDRDDGPSADARAWFGRRINEEFAAPLALAEAQLADLRDQLAEGQQTLVSMTAALTAARADAARRSPIARRVRRLAQRTDSRDGAPWRARRDV